MEKILTIFTGGTIGSKAGGGVLDVDRAAGRELIEGFRKSGGAAAAVDFDVLRPLDILSENLLPRHWGAMYRAACHADAGGYAGVIVTHGTDTLPYSAAAMSCLHAGKKIPLVFVAANLRISHPESNGPANFAHAVRFILQNRIPGVFVVFRNRRGESIVYLGTRLLSADAVSDQYASYMGADFGEMRDGMFVRRAAGFGPDLQALEALERKYDVPATDFPGGVMFVRPYPGLDYSAISLAENKPSAVLHGLYHSSTACSAPEESSAVAFAERCRAQGIDFYMHDGRRCRDENGVYPSAKALLDVGARPLTGISGEAALAKLNVAYNQTAVPPRTYMEENVFFEYVRQPAQTDIDCE
ncbi:MAG: asparaginase [Clostridiales Family XIII bacterium]|jgi:L-asparaginase|nr:asparaginase [Clostridiales Family XIII bacterium]